ncbi:MAG: radical SAM protein [Candidatus Bathyarchaeota archaeon]
MTNVYHVAFSEPGGILSLFFASCNFKCKGCAMKITPWNFYLAEDVRLRLGSAEGVKTLELFELERLLKPLKVNYAVVGCVGEPTIDGEIVDIVRVLKRLKAGLILLLTNGYNLDEDMVGDLKNAGVDEVEVSIKAYTDDIHIEYTGVSNRRVLENFKLLWRMGVKLRCETVVIPRLVEVDEVEKIAKFVASVNPLIPYRVDRYTRAPGAPWRDATFAEVLDAMMVAKKYLKNVYYAEATPPTERVYTVYPKLS